MSNLKIRAAQASDLPSIDMALRDLSRDIGDPHRATQAALEQALFGTPPLVCAQIAVGPAYLGGVALFSPVFSTVRGGLAFMYQIYGSMQRIGAWV